MSRKFDMRDNATRDTNAGTTASSHFNRVLTTAVPFAKELAQTVYEGIKNIKQIKSDYTL
jgi:hypothetical protein